MLRSAILTVLCWLATAGATMAQVTAVPKELVLYAHQDLEADDLVRQLACQLSAVLVAPVRVRPIDMPIDLSLIATGDYLDAERVIRRLYATVAGERQFGADTFVLMLIPYYVFAKHPTFGTTFGMPYNMGVVSIGSLMSPGADLGLAEVRKVVARRAFKVSLRYVAHMSGLWNRNGCVLEFPYGVDGIDRKPAELCEDDRATLVAAGVVKAGPGGACDMIAMAR